MAAFNLRVLRLNRGLSPNDLGQAVGVSGDTIRRLEQGMTPHPATAYKIAQYFGQEVTAFWPDLVKGREVA